MGAQPLCLVAVQRNVVINCQAAFLEGEMMRVVFQIHQAAAATSGVSCVL